MDIRKKLISLLIIITLVGVALVSTSFSYHEAGLNGSFTCSAKEISKIDNIEVVKTVAGLKTEGLIAGKIAQNIQENIDLQGKEIYTANQARIAAKAAQANAASTETAQSEAASVQIVSAGANLNDVEAAILHLINEVRVSNGLSALSANQPLTDIARTRSQDMVSRNYFSHYTPEGTTFFNIMKNCGISWANGGENLGNATPASYGSPQAFINAWLNSPSHRDNMLRSCYRFVGVGVTDGGGRRVVTTIFLN